MSFTRPKREYGVDRFKDWYAPAQSEDPIHKQIIEERKKERMEIKNELIEDMLDVILKHKKEIKKVPQCSHINGASVWAAKRGLHAREADLDKDGTPEVVVFDKDGKTPYVVNGYKIAPSDYPIRKLYWENHQKASDRIKEPKGKWLREKMYTFEDDPDNQWGKKNIKATPLAVELSKYDGFRMPTRPKEMASPYSIFSKFI